MEYKLYEVEVIGRPPQRTRAKSPRQAQNNVRWRLRIPQTAIVRTTEIRKGA